MPANSPRGHHRLNTSVGSFVPGRASAGHPIEASGEIPGRPAGHWNARRFHLPSGRPAGIFLRAFHGLSRASPGILRCPGTGAAPDSLQIPRKLLIFELKWRYSAKNPQKFQKKCPETARILMPGGRPQNARKTVPAGQKNAGRAQMIQH